MRRTWWVGLVLVIACLSAPAGAFAGNEGAAWGGPTWLDASVPDGTSASGISLSELASGGLVATWNQYVSGNAFPEIASEPLGGSWSAPDSLASTAMTGPEDELGGVRTAVDGDGKFVSVWQTPDASNSDQNDVVGAYGTVTPGEAPEANPFTFGAYCQNQCADGQGAYPYTPQVAMSSDGTGSVQAIVTNGGASHGTLQRFASIEGGVPSVIPTNYATPLLADNPTTGDYSVFAPQMAVAPLNAEWTSSMNDTEVALGISNNYSTQYGDSQTAPDDNALVYATTDPADWYTLTPSVVHGPDDNPFTGTLATPAVLPNGNVIVANDADDIDSNISDYGLSVWETGDATAKILDSDTGDSAGYPAVTTFNDGSVTIAYIDDDLADDNSEQVKEVTMSPDGVWSDPVTLSPAGFQVHDVTDAYGPDGTTYVVWDATNTATPADDGIYSSVRLPGGSFTPNTPEAVYTGAGNSINTPKIAIDQTGYATIVAAVQDPGVGYRVAAFTHANPIPPVLATAPTITVVGGGAPKVGSTLLCAGDAWYNRPTEFQEKWLRGTSPIAGATGRSYTATSGDANQTITCEVIASNGDGSSPPAPSKGVSIASGGKSNVSPTTSSVTASNGNTITVTVSCPATAASCAPVVLQISVIEVVVGNKVVAVIAGKKHKKTAVIGESKVTLKPGQKRTVVVKLNGAGRKLLEKHPHLKVLFTVKAGSKKLISKTVTLKKAKKKKKKKEKH